MSNLYYDYVILVIGTLAILNCLFGFFTILLIGVLRLPSNFYRTVLITMTVFQTGYDFFLILYFCPESNTICLDSRGVGVVACGLGATFWSNIMVFMVLYVVLTKRIFPMEKYMHIMRAAILIVSVLNGCFLMFGGSQFIAYQVYNILYVTSIIFNVVAYAVVQYHLHRMQISSKGPNSINAPIKVLSNRLALYPLIQAASRFGPMFYLFLTGNTLADYQDEDSPSVLHTVAAFSSAILSPCAGVGYFITFLCIQKGASAEVIAHVYSAAALCGMSCMNSDDDGAVDTLTVPLHTGPPRWSEPASVTPLEEGGRWERTSSCTNGDDYLAESEIQSQTVATAAAIPPYRMSLDSGEASIIEHLRLYEQMDDDELLREIAKYGTAADRGDKMFVLY